MASLRKRVFRASLFPSLIATAILYTLVYDYMLYDAAQHEVDPDADCLISFGDLGEPSHCSEVRLFHGWHHEEELKDESDSSLLEASPEKTVESETPKQHNKYTSATHRREMSNDLMAFEMGPTGVLERESDVEELHDKTPLTEDVKLLNEWQAQVDKLEATIKGAVHAKDESPWIDDLASLKRLLRLNMNLPTGLPGAASKLFALRHSQLDKLEEALLHAPKEASAHIQWDRLGSIDFDVKQLRVRLEFEMSSHTLSRQSTSKSFADSERSRESTVSETGDTKESNSVPKDVIRRMVDLEFGLAALVSDGKNDLVKETVENATPKPTASFLQKQLSWSSVRSLSHSILLGDASDTHAYTTKQQVRHLHWDGVIPSVACITSITYSRHARARMTYFIDNFKLQDYEGEKQLVFVYHHTDTDAAELLQNYVDGSKIKAVAARGDEEFPSNAALRYGAWSVKADVIARWEFEEWHDPSRLSMQVRSMASTSRPACILEAKPEESTQAAKADVIVVEDTSLAGERSWMKAYWQPYFRQQRDDEVAPPAAHMVQLDLHKHANVANSTQQLSVDAKDDLKKVVDPTHPQAAALHEHTLEECLDLDNVQDIPALTADTETVIDKSLGHQTSKAFHKLMARRHDLTQRLQLLCMETTMASDMQTHVSKKQRVEQMLSIRTELDKHIEKVAELFYSGKSTRVD